MIFILETLEVERKVIIIILYISPIRIYVQLLLFIFGGFFFGGGETPFFFLLNLSQTFFEVEQQCVRLLQS